MPIPNDYLEVIEHLSRTTEAGKLEWKLTAYGNYKTEVAGSIFTTSSGDDEETGVPYVSFALLDAHGAPLDSWFVEPDDDDYETMRFFVALAKRYANKVPSRLESVKKALIDLQGPK